MSHLRDYLQIQSESTRVRSDHIEELFAVQPRLDIRARAQYRQRITSHTARRDISDLDRGRGCRELRQDWTKQMGVPVHIKSKEIASPELAVPG